MNKLLKFIGVISILLLLFNFNIYARSKKNDEGRLQLGAGINFATSNLLGLVDSITMLAKNDYRKYSNLTSISDLSIKKVVAVSNLFSGTEYTLSARVLWKLLMYEGVISFIGCEDINNGRTDLLLTYNLGIRTPSWIMFYLTGGINMTFSFYSDTVTKIETWKNSSYGIYKNFCWRPGVNAKMGLELKFKGFSVGAYYQYYIKDFEEYTKKFSSISKQLRDLNISNASANSVAMLIGYQSRFGLSINLYIF